MTTYISYDELQAHVKTYLDKLVKDNLKGLETTSCTIALTELKEVIKRYSNSKILGKKKKIDGFRIYFYREAPRGTTEDRNTIHDVGGGIGQMSIILVPTNNYDREDKNIPGNETGKDMFIEKRKCLVVMPGNPSGENTGLCPTNCPR